MSYLEKPWLKFYGHVPESVEYSRLTLYEKVKEAGTQYPNAVAWEFMNMSSTFKNFLNEVDHFANGLAALGFKKGDVITIAMPTSPQAIVPIYAVNKLGGICSMIHPLSPAPQIEMYLNISHSRFALTLDAFYPKFAEILKNTSVEKLILTRIPDYLKGPIMKFGFWVKSHKQIKPVPADPKVIWYRDILNAKGS